MHNDRAVLNRADRLSAEASELGIEVEIGGLCFRLIYKDELITSHNNLDYLLGILKGIRWSRSREEQSVIGPRS